MGWYHVDRTGKGVMLNFLDCTVVYQRFDVF